MPKQAISVTLSPENLLWLRGRVTASRARSISEFLDRLIDQARSARAVRSVVGTVEIPASDPELLGADRWVRELFASSVRRPDRSGKRGRMHRPAGVRGKSGRE